MRPGRLLIMGTVLALGVGLAAGCSSDSDKKSSKTTTTESGGGVTVSSAAQGTPVAAELGDTEGTDGAMTLTAIPASVPAGAVTFAVANTGTIKHELVVLQDDTPFDQLTVGSNGKVSEENSAGEAEVEKGETKTVTLDLEAGKYVLACNIKDHYKLGMRAAFTVT